MGFDRLHPSIQHHIVNSFGWRELRPLQEEAVDPILDGNSCLLIAPTAGGKTEAAVLPVLSDAGRIMAEPQRPLRLSDSCSIKQPRGATVALLFLGWPPLQALAWRCWTSGALRHSARAAGYPAHNA